MRRYRVSATCAATALLLAGCVAAGSNPTPSLAPATVTVYAAASLARILPLIAGAYERAMPGATFSFDFDASSALATRIEQGAPADLFLSADTANPARLADAGLTTAAPVVFARNALAIVVPHGSRVVSSPFDLARRGVKVIAAGEAVPISSYAEQLVAGLAGQPGAPPGFAAAVRANIVSREDNVAAVMAKIELGEGDAAIVYSTDASGSQKVATIALPDGVNVPATYGAVVVRASPGAERAATFLAWLRGAAGQAALAGFGFLPAP